MPDLLSALRTGQILLMDGALGTELQKAGIKPGECYESWNLTHPDKVQAIHQAYLEAGAQCLLTNTFQANPLALAKFGLQDRLEEINQTAIQLARKAGTGNHWVIASVGPMDVASHGKEFDSVIRSLSGVDAILLETWSEQFELAVLRATNSANNPGEIPILLSLTFFKSVDSSEPRLFPGGMTATEAVQRVSPLGIASLGVNCGREINQTEIIAILTDYRTFSTLPLLVRPNAGTPIQEKGKLYYPRTLVEVANGIPQYLKLGVQLIGGCCGTTPAHIGEMAKRLKTNSDGKWQPEGNE